MGNDVWPRVRQVLLDWLDSDRTPDQLSVDSRLREDLGLNSLTVVDLIVAIEDEFDISVSDDDLASLVTLRDVVGTIERKVAGTVDG